MRLTAQIQEELTPSPGDPQSRLPPKDLFSGAAARLYEALHATPVKDARHFYQLASLQIRRELIEICSQQESDDRQPFSRLQHFYDCVDRLPEKQREVFELIWYHEIPREEVAQLLGADVVEIRRLWRSARLALHDRLDD